MIREALADRYPVVIADEHQDSSADQHAIIMGLQQAGSWTRIFGDPMQQIFGSGSQAAVAANRARWDETKSAGTYGELRNPHRWKDGSPELGRWILQARGALKNGHQIDLTGRLPEGLTVLHAENLARTRAGYQLSGAHREPIDRIVNSGE